MGPSLGFSYRGFPGFNLAGLTQQVIVCVHVVAFKAGYFDHISADYHLSARERMGGKIKQRHLDLNLRHNTATTMPLSAGLGKTWNLISHYAVDTSVSGQWMLYRQFSNQADQFTLNFTVSLLMPELNL